MMYMDVSHGTRNRIWKRIPEFGKGLTEFEKEVPKNRNKYIFLLIMNWIYYCLHMHCFIYCT